MTQLFYQIELDGKRVAEISAVNDAIHEVVRQLAIKFGVIKERKAGEKRACTLGIETMLKNYRSIHGESGLTDAVEAELEVLHELHPDRVQVHPVCQAHSGITCKYAISRDNGLLPLCGYGDECGLQRSDAS